MKKSLVLLTVLIGLTMTIGLSGCGGDKGDGGSAELPDMLKSIKDNALKTATAYGEKLDGEFGDQMAALLDSGEGEKFKDYKKMQDLLIEYLDESGATYLYVVYPEKVGETALFAIDTYMDEPAGFGDPFYEEEDGTVPPEYQWEPAMTSAWEGTPAASGGGYWEDDDNAYWPAYAPIHDSDGKVVALLGAEFPSPEIWDYPEFDVDDKAFDGPDFFKD